MSLLSILGAGIFLLSLASLKADPAHPNIASVEQDTQILSDLSELNFDQLLASPTGKLALVMITPSKDSGKSIAKAGKDVDIKDPKTGAITHMPQQYILLGDEVSGNYSAFDVYSDKVSINSNRYEWIAHTQRFFGGPIPSIIYEKWRENDDHDRHFLYGGTVICRLDTSTSGSGMFSSDYLVPPAWRSDLPEALRYHQNHPGIFFQDKSKGNYTALLKLLDSTNPFLSIDAARTLLESHLIRTDVVVSHFAKADFYKQAVLTILLLKNASGESQPGLMDELGNLIKKSQSAEELKGIALGAAAAENYSLLNQVDERIPLIQKETPALQYIKDLEYAVHTSA